MQLEQHLKNLILHSAPINMAEFMRIALAYPDYGYYKSKEPFGVKGDFTTAPEISQMFGELIGIWCADVWQKIGGASGVELVEIGPGRGTLMADLLRATRAVPGFHDAISISMVETSDRLIKVQNEKLQGMYPRIKWYKNLSEVPDKPVIIVNNELFDALPVRQYVKKADKWYEKMLGLNKAGGLEFVIARSEYEAERRGNQALKINEYGLQRVACNEGIKEGAILENCQDAIILMQEISARIKKHGGAALIVDYGYNKPEYKDTIIAISNHKHVGLLENIGYADISAHVDFSLLKQVASDMGLQSFGAIGQGDFLRNMGIEFRAASLSKNATEKQKQDIESAKARLIGNGDMQMGELFKVLAVVGDNLAPAGF